ncbi:MAG: hypothetical protein EBT85_04840 [Synechococcaceae bacterium WB5_2B_268]|nr:hypothetical protein [Synechococcaceae bacterium WB5_2B_268]
MRQHPIPPVNEPLQFRAIGIVRGTYCPTKTDGDLVIKIRQLPRADGSRPQPFKLQLKGNIPLEHLRHFLDLRVRLQGELLQIEHWEVIAPMPQRSDRRGGAKKRPRR